MAELQLKQHGTITPGTAVANVPPPPGKGTRVGASGVPAISKTAVERVRARHGEHVDVGGVRYTVEPDGSFRPGTGPVIAPLAATSRRWIRIATQLAHTPKAARPKRLAPKLSAATGRIQFWRAVKSYAALEIDPRARARWDRIKNQYDPSVHALLEARMQEVVRGLTRVQRAELERAKPGRAVQRRDAQHIAGEHLVNTGVVAPPRLGPNSLLNFVIGDLGINRELQRGLEVAAGKGAREAKAAGRDPKQAGVAAAKATSKTRGGLPGMDKLAEAEARIARQPPAVPKVRSLKLKAPRGLARLHAARGAIGMLAQIVLGWVIGKHIAQLQQERLEQELAMLTPSIEAAIAARASQLAALYEANPNADIYLNIRLAYQVETERNEDGMIDIVRGASLVGVEFSYAPVDETPRETKAYSFWGWITTTEVATSTKVDLGQLQ